MFTVNMADNTLACLPPGDQMALESQEGCEMGTFIYFSSLADQLDSPLSGRIKSSWKSFFSDFYPYT